MKTFTLYWSPEGKPVFRTQADSLASAMRHLHYRRACGTILDKRLPNMLKKASGELYWEESDEQLQV